MLTIRSLVFSVHLYAIVLLAIICGMMGVPQTTAKIAIFNSDSGVTPPEKLRPTPRIWLYTSVAVDYNGAALLPHFINHYLDLGVERQHFLVVVNHNPEKNPERKDVDSPGPLWDATSILDSWGIKYRVWLGQYSSEKLLKIRYEMLNNASWDDWIIHADSDEFHDYGVTNVKKYFAQADKEGVNEIKGVYVDRVSETGKLQRLSVSPHLFKQFPLKCQVIKEVTGSRDTKAMAYKGYWRSDRGNHQVLRPARAKSWMAGSPRPGATSNRGVVDAENLYPLTPYSRNPKAYLYLCQPHDYDERGLLAVDLPPGVTCYTGKEKNIPQDLIVRKSKTATVNHFKWHSGLVESVKDRLAFYKGTDTNEGQDGKPRYDWFKDSEKLLAAVVEQGGVDIKSLNCKA